VIFVEGAIVEGQALVADLDPSVREVVDGDVLTSQIARDLVRLKDEHHAVILDR
jgi:hypothetical protein